jgi:hypothetical protein
VRRNLGSQVRPTGKAPVGQRIDGTDGSMRSTGRKGVRASFLTPRTSTYTLSFEGNASPFCALAAHFPGKVIKLRTRQRHRLQKQTFRRREGSTHPNIVSLWGSDSAIALPLPRDAAVILSYSAAISKFANPSPSHPCLNPLGSTKASGKRRWFLTFAIAWTLLLAILADSERE